MPCQYYSPEEERKIALDETKKLKKELDRVTQLLCGITKLIYTKVADARITKAYEQEVPGLKAWYDEHYKMDKNRIKDSIKKKLTQEELDFLKSSSLT